MRFILWTTNDIKVNRQIGIIIDWGRSECTNHRHVFEYWECRQRTSSNTYNVEVQYYSLVVVAPCRITWYQVWPSRCRTWLKPIPRGETIHQNFYFRVVRDYPASTVTLCAPKTVAPNSLWDRGSTGKKRSQLLVSGAWWVIGFSLILRNVFEAQTRTFSFWKIIVR